MAFEAVGTLSDLLDSAPRRPQAATGGYDDETLIARIRETGSEAHFRLLIQRHQRPVFELVASVLGPVHEQHADEVAQDVFVTVYRRLDSFRGDARFSTWLYRVAYNSALEWLRRAARRSVEVSWDETFAGPSAEPGPQRNAASEQTARALQSAIDRLPDLYRTLIHLHYWRGLTVSEMAHTLSASPGTVKSYLHRARNQLQALLGERP